MQTDVTGRVRNVFLPPSKALLPMFEAVVNSIHAIEEANDGRGHIDVVVERQSHLFDAAEGDVTGFVIRDTGVGFTQANFQSFETSDSTYKEKRGGKGIGRFQWLKAFALVHVESNFVDGGMLRRRTFDFALPVGTRDMRVENAPAGAQRNTTVTMRGFSRNYAENCPRGLEIIGRRLIEHCLIYFLSPACPVITISDESGDGTLNLNDEFRNRIFSNSRIDSLSVKDKTFTLITFRLYLTDENRNLLHYCANDRSVLDEALSTEVPDLSKRLHDEAGRSFAVAAYLKGNYLDETSNAERTDFAIPEQPNPLFPHLLSRQDLRSASALAISEYLQPYLAAVRAKKKEQVEEFVMSAPEFRPLLNQKPEVLDTLPSGLSPEKLGVELYKLTAQLTAEVKERGYEILNKRPEDIEDIDQYRREYTRAVEEINEIGKSKLAEYIIHRKLVLDLMEKRLQLTDEGKYRLEDAIHKVILPLRSTSDEVDFERQNLWIIDEKLAYHRFLSSDLPLNQVPLLQTDSAHRPDLLIFDSNFAFVEGDAPFNSIVIVEFKKPVRNDYTDEENPIVQIYDYVRKIREGRAKDRTGRYVNVDPAVRIYAYIICDLTTTMRRRAEEYPLQPSPDNMGYFGFNPKLVTYIELISYDKLLLDARRRNRVLFDKLNLPIHRGLGVSDKPKHT